VVQMSLTDKTSKHLASIATQQEALNDFIFEEFEGMELAEFTGKLAALRNRLEKARLKVALDF
jgi:MarR family transcriptional regulator, organic hydroperoxide resistance regulator